MTEPPELNLSMHRVTALDLLPPLLLAALLALLLGAQHSFAAPDFVRLPTRTTSACLPALHARVRAPCYAAR